MYQRTDVIKVKIKVSVSVLFTRCCPVSCVDCADFNVSVRGAATTEESGDVPTYSYNDTVNVTLDMSCTCDVIQETIAWTHFK